MQANYMMQGGQYNQSRGSRSNVPGSIRAQHNQQFSGNNQPNRPQNRIPGAISQGQPGMRQPHLQVYFYLF